jgi:hypothetical protein
LDCGGGADRFELDIAPAAGFDDDQTSTIPPSIMTTWPVM